MLNSSLLLLANFYELVILARTFDRTKFFIIAFATIVAFAILWIVMHMLDKNKKNSSPTKKKSPVSLFSQLCKTHQLSSDQAKLLKTMTTRAGLQPPEVIFTDPSLWSHCLEQCEQSRESLLEIMAITFGTERVQRWFPDAPVSAKVQ